MSNGNVCANLINADGQQKGSSCSQRIPQVRPVVLLSGMSLHMGGNFAASRHNQKRDYSKGYLDGPNPLLGGSIIDQFETR